MTASTVRAGRQHRLHALEMLLISIRTDDAALRRRYERLSELWLRLAERREGLALGGEPGAARRAAREVSA